MESKPDAEAAGAHVAGAPGPISIREPPRVSIVTPSFQQARFLRQCVESVLAQDYPHIEYSVFDGGSTDGSREILESYGTRFQWISRPDGGQTSAINAGLRRASGAILGYLNSDDVLLPGAVSSVVDAWRRQPDLDLLYGRANYIDEAGEVLREYDTRPYDRATLQAGCYICQPAAFWHRRAVERFGLFDERFQFAMDYEYWQRLAVRGARIRHIEKLLACSREYPGTKTQSGRGRVFREVMRSQWMHWSSVHPEWWEDFLNHLKYERRGVWSRLLPGAAYMPLLARRLSILIRNWPLWLSDGEVRAAVRSRRLEPCIPGYYADGWTHPRFWVAFRLQQRARIRLEGVSPERKRLSVALGWTRREKIETEAGVPFLYERELPPGRYKLRIHSPSTRFPGDARDIGFYVIATNLFAVRGRS
jgi:glycosyltransferase involved in cell wall biosynthesis